MNYEQFKHFSRLRIASPENSSYTFVLFLFLALGFSLHGILLGASDRFQAPGVLEDVAGFRMPDNDIGAAPQKSANPFNLIMFQGRIKTHGDLVRQFQVPDCSHWFPTRRIIGKDWIFHKLQIARLPELNDQIVPFCTPE